MPSDSPEAIIKMTLNNSVAAIATIRRAMADIDKNDGRYESYKIAMSNTYAYLNTQKKLLKAIQDGEI